MSFISEANTMSFETTDSSSSVTMYGPVSPTLSTTVEVTEHISPPTMPMNIPTAFFTSKPSTRGSSIELSIGVGTGLLLVSIIIFTIVVLIVIIMVKHKKRTSQRNFTVTASLQQNIHIKNEHIITPAFHLNRVSDRDMIGDEIHIYDTLSGMNLHYDKHNRDEIHNYDTLSGMNSHCDKHNRHIYDSVPDEHVIIVDDLISDRDIAMNDNPSYI